MNDATHGADNIRNDISALAQRYAVIDRDEECGVIICLCLFLLTNQNLLVAYSFCSLVICNLWIFKSLGQFQLNQLAIEPAYLGPPFVNCYSIPSKISVPYSFLGYSQIYVLYGSFFFWMSKFEL